MITVLQLNWNLKRLIYSRKAFCLSDVLDALYIPDLYILVCTFVSLLVTHSCIWISPENCYTFIYLTKAIHTTNNIIMNYIY